MSECNMLKIRRRKELENKERPRKEDRGTVM